ncbi:MAG: helix-turn-helix domain-containing protein [Dehalococcoidia bacterium]
MNQRADVGDCFFSNVVHSDHLPHPQMAVSLIEIKGLRRTAGSAKIILNPMTPTKTSKPERTQQERSDATTKALINAARELFARDGYEATLLDDVARKAGVTKGALYHHFGGKRALFRAVFEAEERRLMRMTAHVSAKHADSWKGFYEGCRAYLEAVLDPGVQRITLIDAPAVLGFEIVREVEERYTMSLLRNGLQMAIDAGILGRPASSRSPRC